ncbi:MAG: TolC family protein [Elusimicrobia bacterium]|nr:TolC family protein [Elusimicrobiota bacterium]
MKRLLLAAGLLAAWCALVPSARAQESGAPAERPVSLSQAYALSLAHMETIAQDKDAAKQALAHVDELIGDIMPQITGTASNLWEENPGVSIGGVNLTNQPHAAITLNQLLFSGFREFLAFKQGRREYESADMTEKRAEQLLYQDVGQAYVSLLQARDQIRIDAQIVKAGQDQVNFLKRWVEIGRAKRSDLLTAQSVLELAKAQLEQAHQTESAGQEMLKFFTDSSQDLAPEELPAPELGDLQGWLAASERRADVEAARDSYDAARLQTKIISRQRWPTITATGNYYLIQSAFSKNVHYDGSVSLSIPLFTGGAISAQIREAQAQEKSAESGLSLALRTADENVRSSYRNLKWAIGSARAFADAVRAAKKSFTAEKNDFERNLVTNLDVMNSLTSLANTEIQSNAATQQAAFGLVELQVAAGEVPSVKAEDAP